MEDALRLARERRAGHIVWLTGAGISAPSGIPTFRGEGGYWTVGSENYRAEELATYAAFSRIPRDVWGWYLYRRGVCLGAKPNVAHDAIARTQRERPQCTLVTQNVDGLHLQAGSPPESTYQIHGNISFMRPVHGRNIVEIPLPIAWPRGRRLTVNEFATLAVDGQAARPHVLWFDETYDEEHYRFESSIAAAQSADLLIVVGSQGSTNLPLQMAALCARRGTPCIVVDPNDNAFARIAMQAGGVVVPASATDVLPPLADALCGV